MSATRTQPARRASLGRPYAALGAAFALTAAGCSTGDLAPPVRQAGGDLPAPAGWIEAGDPHRGEVSRGWLKTFKDPALERLIGEAIAHNRDLKVAAARLRIVHEGTVQARSSRLPSASASGSGDGSGSKAREGDGDLGPWRHSESYGLSLNLSWEVDLWGRLRDLERAAEADYTAQQADYRGAELSLAANTAKAWFNLVAAGLQVELAEQTRESFARNLRIVERIYKAGDVASSSALDVQFARNNVASAERGLISRQLSVKEAARSLEVLLGRYPSAEIEGGADLPSPASEVPAGLPSELLFRRPDLAAAAADLRASADRADAARKNLLPSFALSGRGSTGTDRLYELLADPAFLSWSLGSSVAQNLYRGGAVRSGARQAAIANELAAESFAATALRGFREVESALSTEASLAAQEEFLKKELAQANLAEVQASRDYSEGIVGYLSVLEAQRRAFNARNAMISLRNQRLQNRVDLHLALGGDFAPPGGPGAGITPPRTLLGDPGGNLLP